jgi:PadR family transcriptional regulator AphA
VPPRASLSLTEHAVLALLVEAPRHGYELAAELRPGTELGAIWRVDRQLVYRALDRLAELGLAVAVRQEAGAGGPRRTVYGPTRRGRPLVRRWLTTPVEHIRDVRAELLLKLVLAGRLGIDPAPLVAAQQEAFRRQLAPLLAAPERGDVVALWRHHSATAALRFLADVGPPIVAGDEREAR